MKTLKFKINIVMCMIAFVTVLSSCKKDVIEGCMDPDSVSYNTEANVDDGSCAYAEEKQNALLLRVSPRYVVSNAPISSSLEHYKGLYNDAIIPLTVLRVWEKTDEYKTPFYSPETAEKHFIDACGKELCSNCPKINFRYTGDTENWNSDNIDNVLSRNPVASTASNMTIEGNRVSITTSTKFFEETN